MSHVLHEPFASERTGKTLCLRAMTAIGPCSSGDPEEWMRFESKEVAGRHLAVFHSLTFYEPKDEAELADPQTRKAARCFDELLDEVNR